MYSVEVNVKSMGMALGNRAEAVLDEAVTVLGEWALSQLQTRVQERLSIQQMERYLKATKTERQKGFFRVYLDDDQSERLELGYASFDLKPYMLDGPAKKMTLDGEPYQDVPFLHRTTARGQGTLVTSVGTKKLVNMAVRAVKTSGEAQRLFGKRPGSPATRYTDMKVMPVSTKAGPRAVAKTWRRVSGNSPSGSWIHPGVKGIKAFQDVFSELMKIKDQVVRDIAAGIQ